MHPWIQRHRQFLREIEAWYVKVRASQGQQMQCGNGCALCCHGVFDISVADALLVAEAFAGFPPEQKAAVAGRARAIQERICAAAPELTPPYILDAVSEEQVEVIVDHANSPPCVFLGVQNECLIYERRPLACRLEGLPMVDAQDGLFGDWCELNFIAGVPPASLKDLECDYYELRNVEEVATEIVSEEVTGCERRQLTVFIPSIVAGFESFWAPFVIIPE
jgi:Fe-S-cluster containining protein